MLKKPSSRRKTKSSQVQLNLVPILDTMVTLIAFLLYTMAFLTIVGIETPFPQASAQINEEKLKEKPLQLTLTLKEEGTEIWSPFGRVKPIKISNGAEGLPDLVAIHEALVGIKKNFPLEQQLVIVPFSALNYDALVSVMDAVRMMEPGDTPIFAKNTATGVDVAVKQLFPNLVFGNLLGD